jgi:hypothetical protein
MAGPQPRVALRNTPSDYNLSFGKNMFTLEDTGGATDVVKFGLNVLSGCTTGGTQVATFRQFENPAGVAHFDLQNTLKNYTTINYNLESITGITGAPDETFRFMCELGHEINGTFSIDSYATGSTGSCYCVIGGRKLYWDVDWVTGFDQHASTITYNGSGCPSSVSRIFALSDWTQPKSNPGADAPSWTSGQSILTQKIPADNQATRTLSFINRLVAGAGPTVNDASKSIKFFRVTIMSGTTELDDFIIDNITSNGGGPNNTIGGTTFDEYPYDVITIQAGHNMWTGDTSNATHWFIAPFTWQDSGSCIGSPIEPSMYPTPLSYVYRFDVDEGECNDFEYVDFSWLNSYGFRDYFTFRKRRDHNISINKNTFEKVDGSWSAADYDINQYDRGEQVFSQSLTDRYTVNTGYLSDEEAEFLKNLYISADVKVRFEGEAEYTPVIVEDNTWTERTFRKDKLFQNTCTFRIAHKLNSQRG